MVLGAADTSTCKGQAMSMCGEIENTEREIVAAEKHLDNLKKRLFDLQGSAQLVRVPTAEERVRLNEK